MPTTNSNITLYATYKASINQTKIAAATAANTYTLIDTGVATGSIVTDILFRSLDAARLYDIIICPTGSNADSKYIAVRVGIPGASGSNGSTALASLAALCPQLFDIDLAGNRIITLESGISIYVMNTTATTGDMNVISKRRDY